MPEESLVKRLFSDLAAVYDRGNTVITLGAFQKWQETFASLCVTLLPETSCPLVLDVGCGSGSSMNAFLTKKGSTQRVVGVDFCLPMLQVASAKLNALHSNVAFICSNVLNLPFASNSFDLVYCAFVMRHVASRRDALFEMARTLKKGGYVLVMELSHPEKKAIRLFFDIYLGFVIPLLGSASNFFRKNTFSQFRYLYKTWKAFPNAQMLKTEMEEVGLERAEYVSLAGGIVCIHLARKPYL